MPKKSFGVSQLRELVAVVAGPRRWGEGRKTWLARAASRSGISFRQCWAVFYGEITDPEHKSVRKLQAAAAARNGNHLLADGLETTARFMSVADPEHYADQINALIDIAKTLRNGAHK